MHIATVSLSMAPFCLHAHACRYLFNLYNYTFFLHAAYSYRYSYILVVATYNITFKNQFAIHKMPFNMGPECMVYSVSAL